MDSGPAAGQRSFDHEAAEFVRFCYRRRRVGWPELYDEMCAVAARGLYQGLGTDDLAAIGIGFSLFDMSALAGLANSVVAEEHAKRRPVAVAIVGHPSDAVTGVDAGREQGSATGSLVGTAATD